MVRRSPGPRGASLIEVLVSAAIMAMLTTLAATVVLAVSAYFHRAVTSYELHQDALTALNSLARELSSSNRGAVDAPPGGGVAFALPSLDHSQSPPALEWVGWICYCSMPVKGEPALVRMEQPITPPSASVPAGVPFDRMVSAFQASGLRSKLMAAHLSSFTVATFAASPPARPTAFANITLQLAQKNPRLYSVKVTTSVPFPQ